MSAQTSIEAEVPRADPEATAKRKAARGDSTYIVQMAKTVWEQQRPDEPGAEPLNAWQDIATVTVPPKSPRKKVIGLALAQSGIRPAADSEPLCVRVLDAASFHETKVAPFQPDAEWKIA